MINTLCKSGHCICGALSTTDDPPEVGKRIQAYAERWEFITWNNGDQYVFTHWRPELEGPTCRP